MRKIIQIATGRWANDRTYLTALCDDGTVFIERYMNEGVPNRWEQIDPIPQPDSQPPQQNEGELKDETKPIFSEKELLLEEMYQACRGAYHWLKGSPMEGPLKQAISNYEAGGKSEI